MARYSSSSSEESCALSFLAVYTLAHIHTLQSIFSAFTSISCTFGFTRMHTQLSKGKQCWQAVLVRLASKAHQSFPNHSSMVTEDFGGLTENGEALVVLHNSGICG